MAAMQPGEAPVHGVLFLFDDEEKHPPNHDRGPRRHGHEAFGVETPRPALKQIEGGHFDVVFWI